MQGFEDQFEIELDISATHFAGNLTLVILSENDSNLNGRHQPGKSYRGVVKYQQFRLSSLHKHSYTPLGTIKGTFKSHGQKLLVKCRIINYLPILIFNLIFPIVFIALLANRWLLQPSHKGEIVLFGFFSMAGLINYWFNINQLEKLKKEFVDLVVRFQ